MRPRDLADLVLLGALWGGSFLFMRVAVPHFGALPVAALRVAGAALLLLPWLALQGHGAALRQHWRPIALVGLTNSALPFLGFSLAARDLPAGLSSILNAASPMFGALIAMLWLREPTPASRLADWGWASPAWCCWAAMPAAATRRWRSAFASSLRCSMVSRPVSRAFSRRHHRLPWPRAASCQPHSCWLLPPRGLAGGITAMDDLVRGAGAGAAVHRHRLRAVLQAHRRHQGARAITVTFLVPAFAMVWAAWFLDELVTPAMLAVCALILLGTGLATGVLRLPRQAAQ